MNLFWKIIFGAMTPTAKLEKNEIDLVTAMKRYAEVEKSIELAEYKRLFHVVKSAEFKENKKTLQNRKYKDTEEFRVSKKYYKLADNPAISLYYDVLKSNDLAEYLRFKSSNEYESLGDKSKVKASKSLSKYKIFEDSKAYKTYVRFHNSFIIKDFEAAKVKLENPDFKNNNEFWANANRWQTTSEFLQEKRFYELSQNPDIVFYINEKPERFEKYRALTLKFNDEFEWHTLDKSLWNFGFHYKNPLHIGNHSFANEKQANNSGRNVTVENGTLKIITRPETVKARAWHQEKGFIEKEFEFTSDVLQTAENFRQQRGIFRAKLRCTGNIHHAFWLGADSKLPQINIFHYNGKYVSLGNSNINLVDGVKITGLNPDQFFIYTLVWSERELIWMINDVEVHRTVSNLPNEAMYLVFNSFITEQQKGTSGSLDVDWVRVYSN